MNKGDLVEKVARAIYDATDPLSGDPVAVVIHMSDLLHWEGVASGQMMPDIERQKLAIMEVCRAAATAAIGVCQAEAADEIARLREALEPFVEGAAHTQVFLRSREKMHPAGQELYQQDVDRARAALQHKEPQG